jgi:Myb-like DNA-binding domain
MASMPHSGSLHPSVQDWSHGNEFLSHVQQMPQQQQQAYLGRDYQLLASHHHRLPSQTRHTSLPRQYQTSPLEVMGGSGTTSVVGQAGMPAPASRPRVPKLKFSAQEDQMLVELKENKNLTWKQIAEFFPGRSSGTLQVRYCTKLKAKTVIWTDESVSSILTWVRGLESGLTMRYSFKD